MLAVTFRIICPAVGHGLLARGSWSVRLTMESMDDSANFRSVLSRVNDVVSLLVPRALWTRVFEPCPRPVMESVRARCTAPLHRGPVREPSMVRVIFMDVVPAPHVTTAPDAL